MSNKLEILSLWGFRRDPFYGHDIVSADAVRVRSLLAMAISAHAQISIVGERGIGKTRAVNAALRDLKIKPVRILTPDKSRTTASDIQEALLIELAPGERVRQDREVRVRQLRRILGEASKRESVVVVIDEAHRLHGNTLRSLKNLRELDWMGETHLFTAVLVGQSDSTQNIGLAEVRLRTDVVHMHGLTGAEITEYVGNTVGSVFEDDAVGALAGLTDARNYLDLQDLLVKCMANALTRGAEKVGKEDVGELERAGARSTIDGAKSGARRNALSSVLNRRAKRFTAENAETAEETA